MIYIKDGKCDGLVNILAKKISLSLFFSVLCITHVRSQDGIIGNNVNYNHFLANSGAQIASMYQSGTSSAHIMYQSNIGLLSDIKDFYGDVVFDVNNKHHIGLQVYQHQLTSLFTRSKAFGLYAVTVDLSPTIRWTTGVRLGAANIFFGASGASNGGSDWAFDGTISSSIKSERWSLGLGLQQLTQPTLQPIFYEFQLKRYLEGIATRLFDLTPNVQYRFGLRSIVGASTFLVHLDNYLKYKEFGALMVSFQGFAINRFSAGFEIFVPKTAGLALTLGYQITANSNRTNDRQIQIGINYNRQKRKS